jgi:hypothetical protein
MPDSVFFTLDRRVDAADQLAVLNEASFRVYLDDLDTPSTLTLVDQPITDQPTWASLPAVAVDPGDLAIGHDYQFRIVIELDAQAVVLPGGTFDYDNVLMRATLADTVPTDTDGDTVPDSSDNCVNVPNPGQGDADGDRIGDACDQTPGGPDTDHDGITDPLDNCDNTANPNQADTDKDGIGDACDSTPNGPATGTCQGSSASLQVGQASGDTLRGTEAKDLLKGEKGNDRVVGRGGDDCLKGGQGKDILRGQGGKDAISGNAGRDVLTGQTGTDTLRGQRGNDKLEGGRRDDRLNGGLGSDRLDGDTGNDLLLGGNQADRITGGHGKDVLSGGRGDDRLFAVDDKADVVRCGGGMDKVVVDVTDLVAPSCEIVVSRT